MPAYLNQFKRRLAHQMGLDSKRKPQDQYGTRELMDIWGLRGEQPQNIYYRNRSECDSIWLPEVLSDQEIGGQVRKKVNTIVSKEVKLKPDLNVWDMDSMVSGNDFESKYESKEWLVTFKKQKGTYLMRIYKKV